MCLTSIDRRYLPNDNIMVCYKVFIKYDYDMFICSIKNFKPMKIGIHYRSDDKTINPLNHLSLPISYELSYESGFHSFTSLKDAQDYARRWNETICEVHVWDIRTIGGDCNFIYGKIVVAKNMRIVKVIKDYSYLGE